MSQTYNVRRENEFERPVTITSQSHKTNIQFNNSFMTRLAAGPRRGNV